MSFDTWKADIFDFSFTCTIYVYEMTINFESFDGKQNLKRAACKIVLLDLSPFNVDFSALSNWSPSAWYMMCPCKLYWICPRNHKMLQVQQELQNQSKYNFKWNFLAVGVHWSFPNNHGKLFIFTQAYTFKGLS